MNAPTLRTVRADELPDIFECPTTDERLAGRENAYAMRFGGKVAVTFLGRTVVLPPDARVRIVG